ncbi:MAG: hypothetical protein AB7I27_02590 [Bacteriovoracaceae bacterium]
MTIFNPAKLILSLLISFSFSLSPIAANLSFAETSETIIDLNKADEMNSDEVSAALSKIRQKVQSMGINHAQFKQAISNGITKLNRELVKRMDKLSEKKAKKMLDQIEQGGQNLSSEAVAIIQNNELSYKERIKALYQGRSLKVVEEKIYSYLSQHKKVEDYLDSVKKDVENEQLVSQSNKSSGRAIASDEVAMQITIGSLLIAILIICVYVLIWGPITIVIGTKFAAIIVGIPVMIGIIGLIWATQQDY